MTVSYSSFIEAFPEFANPETYPPGTFLFWQGIAALRLNASRWGALLDFGAQLFVAHNMLEQARALKVAESGGTSVGQVTGPLSAKAIDKISMAFNTDAVTVEGAGDWNATTYGIRFYQLALQLGSGGLQL